MRLGDDEPPVDDLPLSADPKHPDWLSFMPWLNLMTLDLMIELAILSWPRAEIIIVPMICSTSSCSSDLQIGFRSSAGIWPRLFYGLVYAYGFWCCSVTYFSSETRLIFIICWQYFILVLLEIKSINDLVVMSKRFFCILIGHCPTYSMDLVISL